MISCCADASVNATFSGFRPDQVIHSPTDIGLIISRVQVLSSSDTAAASRLNQAITLAPYNTSGMPMLLLSNACDLRVAPCNAHNLTLDSRCVLNMAGSNVLQQHCCIRCISLIAVPYAMYDEAARLNHDACNTDLFCQAGSIEHAVHSDF